MGWDRNGKPERSLETLLSDARDQRIRKAVGRAIGEWLEASPLGYKRSIATLSMDELEAIGSQAVAEFIKVATWEQHLEEQASPLVQWLIGA